MRFMSNQKVKFRGRSDITSCSLINRLPMNPLAAAALIPLRITPWSGGLRVLQRLLFPSAASASRDPLALVGQCCLWRRGSHTASGAEKMGESGEWMPPT